MLSLWGQVNNQNLYGYQSLRNNLNSACGGISSSHPLSVNERIEIQRGVGVDINYQGGSERLSSHPKSIQCAPRPRAESQPNVSGLGFITEYDRFLQVSKINLESGAAGVLERFEGMKMENNEFKNSAESQLISLDVINDKAYIITK